MISGKPKKLPENAFFRSHHESFNLISGDDIYFLNFLKKGGSSVISVTANIVPQKMHLICKKTNEKN